MKVGIMSMQRIANYGSFMQAYALKNIIKSLGHDVEFVDYRIGEPLFKDSALSGTVTAGNKFFALRFFLKKLLGREIYFYERYKKMLPLLGVGLKMNYGAKTDTLVIGSDEVFNCLQTNPDVGFSPELFGKDANARRVITYAASFGHTTKKGLEDAGKYNEVKSYLENISSYSARDANTEEILTSMGIENIQRHLDPVLMYDFEKEIKFKNDVKDYILVYSYAGRISNKDEIDAIKSFAKKQNKKLVSVGFHQPWTDIKLEANPFELLGYIKNADFVVTDTFHGSIFSVITKSKFAVIVRNSNRQKLTSLLEGLGLTHRIVQSSQLLEECITADIDYNKTFDIIHAERERTRTYLKENL